ncbi:MAG TPA: phosphotransferase [Kribbella sp.]|jgi:aminoglycoside phosphotransferase (APT) family kinase protein
MTITDDGWDSRAWADGDWLYRDPRRPEVYPRLLAETRLMPWLAPQLPLPVPVPEPTATGVRHRLLVGVPMEDDIASTTIGHSLGLFLKALHSVEPAAALSHGATDERTAAAARSAELERMRAGVLPLLPTRLQPTGKELLDTVQTPHTSLIHGDLGPGHILIQDGVVTGIIDWTDSHLGDPALDLSWLLYGASEPMARAVGDAYGVREDEQRRALGWYRLAPWYNVGHGLVTGRPEVVESALAEVIARLSGRRNG